MMKILGYSERGFINAILYEIVYREPCEAKRLAKGLFALAHWPKDVPRVGLFDACETVLVEQSFSDFGDADGLFRFDSGDGGAVVFFEGKRGEDYTVKRAWKKFIDAFWSKTRSKGLTSNLFCQLYFKQRLAQALSAGSGEDVEQGLAIDAPFDLVARKRKIGDNSVVHASVEMIRKRLGDVRYLLMVPERWTDNLNGWWSREVATPIPAPTGWDVSHWGIITIPEIVQFCRNEGLAHTLNVVEHNEGQLYVEPVAARSSDVAARPDAAKWLNEHGKRGVAVVYAPAVKSNTSLHFSWDGAGCAFRDYSTASGPPNPMRKRLADALPLIQKHDQHSARKLGTERVAEWRTIIDRQNRIWEIGDVPPG